MIVHRGGCHCGRVRFEVTAPASPVVLECNCTICTKSGYLHLVVPVDRFRLVCGTEHLETYTFNTRTAQHLFCRTCGVKSFYVPRADPWSRSVNARCLDPGTIEGMTVRQYNGRRWGRR
jgi:hypothetical protein